MSMISRMVQPGVTITLHPARPGGRGGELVASDVLRQSVFALRGEQLQNMQRVNMEARGSGTMRYAAAWIEGKLEGVGKLEKEEQVRPGDLVYFERGELRLERERRNG